MTSQDIDALIARLRQRAEDSEEIGNYDAAYDETADVLKVQAARIAELEQDAQRLDLVLNQQLIVSHARDCEYWGIVQVFEDDGELVVRILERAIHNTPRDAVDAALN